MGGAGPERQRQGVGGPAGVGLVVVGHGFIGGVGAGQAAEARRGLRQGLHDRPQNQQQCAGGREAGGGRPEAGAEDPAETQRQQNGQEGRQQAVDFYRLADHGVFRHDLADDADGQPFARSMNAQREEDHDGDRGGECQHDDALAGNGGTRRRVPPEPRQGGQQQRGRQQGEERHTEIGVVGHARVDGRNQSRNRRGVGGHLGQGAAAGQDGTGQMVAHPQADGGGGGHQEDER